MEKRNAGKAAFAVAAALVVALGLVACGSQASSSASSSSAGSDSASASSVSASGAASSASGSASSASTSEGYEFISAFKGTGSDGNVYYYATDETAENTAIVIYDEAAKTGTSFAGPFTMESDGVSISVTDRDSGEKIAFEATTDGKGHQLYKFDNGQDVIMDVCPANEVVEVIASIG